MAGLEPPMPSIRADDFEDGMSGSALGTEGGGTKKKKKGYGKAGRRTVGLLMLAVVVFLWTASNFLASDILADDSYSKPFFITYVNTAFFVIPLAPILIFKALRRPAELQQWRDDTLACLRSGRRYVPLLNNNHDDGAVYADNPRAHSRRASNSASSELLLGDPMETSQVLSAKDLLTTSPDADDASAPLSLHEHGKLALEFCMLWFLANYFVAACLEYTTVASSTILTSTSSVFTLLFGSLFGVEKFTLRKLCGVLASLAGIALISSQDFGGESSADDEHRGDFPEKSPREIAIGDALALASAVMYGIYAVVMKKRIADERRVSMPLFFGLVGLVNVCALWPLFFALHATGIEAFALPPTARVTLIVLANSVTSLVSDLCWAYAVLFTSPIVVTVGLSMTIPLSLVGQLVLNGQTASVVYWVGAMVVVLAFVFVNREEEKDEDEVHAAGGSVGEGSSQGGYAAVRRDSGTSDRGHG